MNKLKEEECDIYKAKGIQGYRRRKTKKKPDKDKARVRTQSEER